MRGASQLLTLRILTIFICVPPYYGMPWTYWSPSGPTTREDNVEITSAVLQGVSLYFRCMMNCFKNNMNLDLRGNFSCTGTSEMRAVHSIVEKAHPTDEQLTNALQCLQKGCRLQMHPPLCEMVKNISNKESSKSLITETITIVPECSGSQDEPSNPDAKPESVPKFLSDEAPTASQNGNESPPKFLSDAGATSSQKNTKQGDEYDLDYYYAPDGHRKLRQKNTSSGPPQSGESKDKPVYLSAFTPGARRTEKRSIRDENAKFLSDFTPEPLFSERKKTQGEQPLSSKIGNQDYYYGEPNKKTLKRQDESPDDKFLSDGYKNYGMNKPSQSSHYDTTKKNKFTETTRKKFTANMTPELNIISTEKIKPKTVFASKENLTKKSTDLTSNGKKLSSKTTPMTQEKYVTSESSALNLTAESDITPESTQEGIKGNESDVLGENSSTISTVNDFQNSEKNNSLPDTTKNDEKSTTAAITATSTPTMGIEKDNKEKLGLENETTDESLIFNNSDITGKSDSNIPFTQLQGSFKYTSSTQDSDKTTSSYPLMNTEDINSASDNLTTGVPYTSSDSLIVEQTSNNINLTDEHEIYDEIQNLQTVNNETATIGPTNMNFQTEKPKEVNMAEIRTTTTGNEENSSMKSNNQGNFTTLSFTDPMEQQDISTEPSLIRGGITTNMPKYIDTTQMKGVSPTGNLSSNRQSTLSNQSDDGKNTTPMFLSDSTDTPKESNDELKYLSEALKDENDSSKFFSDFVEPTQSSGEKNIDSIKSTQLMETENPLNQSETDQITLTGNPDSTRTIQNLQTKTAPTNFMSTGNPTEPILSTEDLKASKYLSDLTDSSQLMGGENLEVSTEDTYDRNSSGNKFSTGSMEPKPTVETENSEKTTESTDSKNPSSYTETTNPLDSTQSSENSSAIKLLPVSSESTQLEGTENPIESTQLVERGNPKESAQFAETGNQTDSTQSSEMSSDAKLLPVSSELTGLEGTENPSESAQFVERGTPKESTKFAETGNVMDSTQSSENSSDAKLLLVSSESTQLMERGNPTESTQFAETGNPMDSTQFSENSPPTKLSPVPSQSKQLGGAGNSTEPTKPAAKLLYDSTESPQSRETENPITQAAENPQDIKFSTENTAVPKFLSDSDKPTQFTEDTTSDKFSDSTEPKNFRETESVSESILFTGKEFLPTQKISSDATETSTFAQSGFSPALNFLSDAAKSKQITETENLASTQFFPEQTESNKFTEQENSADSTESTKFAATKTQPASAETTSSVETMNKNVKSDAEPTTSPSELETENDAVLKFLSENGFQPNYTETGSPLVNEKFTPTTSGNVFATTENPIGTFKTTDKLTNYPTLTTSDAERIQRMNESGNLEIGYISRTLFSTAYSKSETNEDYFNTLMQPDEEITMTTANSFNFDGKLSQGINDSKVPNSWINMMENEPNENSNDIFPQYNEFNTDVSSEQRNAINKKLETADYESNTVLQENNEKINAIKKTTIPSNTVQSTPVTGNADITESPYSHTSATNVEITTSNTFKNDKEGPDKSKLIADSSNQMQSNFATEINGKESTTPRSLNSLATPQFIYSSDDEIKDENVTNILATSQQTDSSSLFSNGEEIINSKETTQTLEYNLLSTTETSQYEMIRKGKITSEDTEDNYSELMESKNSTQTIDNILTTTDLNLTPIKSSDLTSTEDYSFSSIKDNNPTSTEGAPPEYFGGRVTKPQNDEIQELTTANENYVSSTSEKMANVSVSDASESMSDAMESITESTLGLTTPMNLVSENPSNFEQKTSDYEQATTISTVKKTTKTPESENILFNEILLSETGYTETNLNEDLNKDSVYLTQKIRSETTTDINIQETENPSTTNTYISSTTSKKFITESTKATVNDLAMITDIDVAETTMNDKVGTNMNDKDQTTARDGSDTTVNDTPDITMNDRSEADENNRDKRAFNKRAETDANEPDGTTKKGRAESTVNYGADATTNDRTDTTENERADANVNDEVVTALNEGDKTTAYVRAESTMNTKTIVSNGAVNNENDSDDITANDKDETNENNKVDTTSKDEADTIRNDSETVGDRNEATVNNNITAKETETINGSTETIVNDWIYTTASSMETTRNGGKETATNDEADTTMNYEAKTNKNDGADANKDDNKTANNKADTTVDEMSETIINERGKITTKGTNINDSTKTTDSDRVETTAKNGDGKSVNDIPMNNKEVTVTESQNKIATEIPRVGSKRFTEISVAMDESSEAVYAATEYTYKEDENEDSRNFGGSRKTDNFIRSTNHISGTTISKDTQEITESTGSETSITISPKTTTNAFSTSGTEASGRVENGKTDTLDYFTDFPDAPMVTKIPNKMLENRIDTTKYFDDSYDTQTRSTKTINNFTPNPYERTTEDMFSEKAQNTMNSSENDVGKNRNAKTKQKARLNAYEYDYVTTENPLHENVTPAGYSRTEQTDTYSSTADNSNELANTKISEAEKRSEYSTEVNYINSLPGDSNMYELENMIEPIPQNSNKLYSMKMGFLEDPMWGPTSTGKYEFDTAINDLKTQTDLDAETSSFNPNLFVTNSKFETTTISPDQQSTNQNNGMITGTENDIFQNMKTGTISETEQKTDLMNMKKFGITDYFDETQKQASATDTSENFQEQNKSLDTDNANTTTSPISTEAVYSYTNTIAFSTVTESISDTQLNVQIFEGKSQTFNTKTTSTRENEYMDEKTTEENVDRSRLKEENSAMQTVMTETKLPEIFETGVWDIAQGEFTTYSRLSPNIRNEVDDTMKTLSTTEQSTTLTVANPTPEAKEMGPKIEESTSTIATTEEPVTEEIDKTTTEVVDTTTTEVVDTTTTEVVDTTTTEVVDTTTTKEVVASTKKLNPTPAPTEEIAKTTTAVEVISPPSEVNATPVAALPRTAEEEIAETTPEIVAATTEIIASTVEAIAATTTEETYLTTEAIPLDVENKFPGDKLYTRNLLENRSSKIRLPRTPDENTEQSQFENFSKFTEESKHTTVDEIINYSSSGLVQTLAANSTIPKNSQINVKDDFSTISSTVKEIIELSSGYEITKEDTTLSDKLSSKEQLPRTYYNDDLQDQDSYRKDVTLFLQTNPEEPSSNSKDFTTSLKTGVPFTTTESKNEDTVSSSGSKKGNIDQQRTTLMDDKFINENLRNEVTTETSNNFEDIKSQRSDNLATLENVEASDQSTDNTANNKPEINTSTPKEKSQISSTTEQYMKQTTEFMNKVSTAEYTVLSTTTSATNEPLKERSIFSTGSSVEATAQSITTSTTPNAQNSVKYLNTNPVNKDYTENQINNEADVISDATMRNAEIVPVSSKQNIYELDESYAESYDSFTKTTMTESTQLEQISRASEKTKIMLARNISPTSVNQPIDYYSDRDSSATLQTQTAATIAEETSVQPNNDPFKTPNENKNSEVTTTDQTLTVITEAQLMTTEPQAFATMQPLTTLTISPLELDMEDVTKSTKIMTGKATRNTISETLLSWTERPRINLREPPFRDYNIDEVDKSNTEEEMQRTEPEMSNKEGNQSKRLQESNTATTNSYMTATEESKNFEDMPTANVVNLLKTLLTTTSPQPPFNNQGESQKASEKVTTEIKDYGDYNVLLNDPDFKSYRQKLSGEITDFFDYMQKSGKDFFGEEFFDLLVKVIYGADKPEQLLKYEVNEKSPQERDIRSTKKNESINLKNQNKTTEASSEKPPLEKDHFKDKIFASPKPTNTEEMEDYYFNAIIDEIGKASFPSLTYEDIKQIEGVIENGYR